MDVPDTPLGIGQDDPVRDLTERTAPSADARSESEEPDLLVTPSAARPKRVHRSHIVAALVVVVTALVLHVGLVRMDHRSRGTLWHDEAISLEAASGHLDEMQAIGDRGAAPAGRWSSGAEWRALLDNTSPGVLDVRSGLADYDVHPPLYFWLLRAGLVAGLSPTQVGTAVNLVLSVATAALIGALVFGATRRLIMAAAAAAFFLLSPAVIVGTAEARQYMLATFFVVALIAVTVRWVGRDFTARPIDMALFGGVALGGLLTLHPFAMWLLGALVLIVLAALTASATAARLKALGIALAAAAVTYLVIFPYAIKQNSSVQGRDPGWAAQHVGKRFVQSLESVRDIVTMRHADAWARWVPILFVVAAVVAIAVPVLRGGLRELFERPVFTVSIALTALVIVLSAVAYALGRVPAHALGTRYVTPIAAGATVALFTFLDRALVLRLLALTVTVLIAIGTVASTRAGYHSFARQRANLEHVRNARTLVIDCTRRGDIGSVATQIAPDARVYVARAAVLGHRINAHWVREMGPSALFLQGRCTPNAPDLLGAFKKAGVDRKKIGQVERFLLVELTVPASAAN